MKKSTIITIVAFVLGTIILVAGFVLLVPNNITINIWGEKDEPDQTDSTTTTTIPTTTTKPTTTTTRVTYEPLDLFDPSVVSEYVMLGDYKNMTLETNQVEASDEDVDWQLAILLSIQKEFTKNRSGKVGEKVIFSFDFTGYLTKEDGTKDKAFNGGAGTDQLAYIEDGVLYTLSSSGIGSFIDGFAQGMLNAEVGSTLDLNIKFPDDYHSADLKGKNTIFEVKINYLVDVNFSDGWVKEYTKGEYKTCAEYREYIRGIINDMIKESNTTKLWEQIISNAVVEIPEQHFNYLYYTYRYLFEDYAEKLEMSYEDFLKSGYVAYLYNYDIIDINVSSDEELVTTVNDNIKFNLVMMAIIQAEDLKATDEEYRMLLDSIMEQEKKTEAEVLEKYSEEEIRQQIVLHKIDDYIYDLNKFVIENPQ